jgi:hypothetical protein
MLTRHSELYHRCIFRFRIPFCRRVCIPVVGGGAADGCTDDPDGDKPAAGSSPGSALSADIAGMSAAGSGSRVEEASGGGDEASSSWWSTGDRDRRDRSAGPGDDGVARKRVEATGERDQRSVDRTPAGDVSPGRWCGRRRPGVAASGG